MRKSSVERLSKKKRSAQRRKRSNEQLAVYTASGREKERERERERGRCKGERKKKIPWWGKTSRQTYERSKLKPEQTAEE